MDSMLNYFGGKSVLSKTLVKYVPEHKTYVEPFCGAAWFYFRKPPSKIEILNDINSNLISIYKVIKSHKDEFLRCAMEYPVSRELYNQFKSELSTIDNLTDIERAVRYYYLIMNGYGGKVDYHGFSSASQRLPKYRREFIERRVNDAAKRLESTIIENKHYSEVINKYDTADTFFYIDSPYYGIEDCYGKDIFKREDYAKLALQLKYIKGKFLMSINDKPEIRHIFKDFIINEVVAPYSINNGNKYKEFKELLISNYNYPTDS